MLMIGKTELAKRLYTAWRDAAPGDLGMERGLPPTWGRLSSPEQARWKYVAEQIGPVLAEAMGAEPLGRLMPRSIDHDSEIETAVDPNIRPYKDQT